MATIDPSIALQVRPMADPMESYGKAVQLKSLANQQRMQEAEFARYEENQAAERKLNELYRGNIGADGQVNRQGVISGAASAGLGSRIPGLQKTFAEADKATAEVKNVTSQISERDFNVLKKRADATNGMFSSLLSRPNVTQDDVIQGLASLVDQGFIKDTDAAAAMRQLPPPERLRDFLMGKALEAADASKRLDMLTPKFEKIDAGNRVIPGTSNPLTGQFSPQGAPIVKAPEGFVVGQNGGLTVDPGFLGAKKQIAAAGRPVTNVNVNTNKTLLNEVASGLGKQLDDGLAGANTAVGTIQSARNLRTALDSGRVITGPGANQRIFLTQLGTALGVVGKDAEETLAQTSAAIQNLAQGELQAAQGMKGQGAITDAERALLKRAAGGDISMTESELRTLSNTIERTANARIAAHQANVERLRQVPGGDSLMPFYSAPQPPEPAGMPVGQAPATAAPAAAPASAPAKPAAATWKDAGYQSPAQAVQDARNAIQRGADKAAVVQRLEAAGITNHGIR